MDKDYRVVARVIDFQFESESRCLKFDIGDEFDLSDSDLRNKLCPQVFQSLFQFHLTEGSLSKIDKPRVCYIPCASHDDTIVFEIITEEPECEIEEEQIEFECTGMESSHGIIE